MACRPAAVVILVGTNDVRADTPVERYRDELAALVDHVRSRTNARIAVLSLPPLGEDLDTEINRRLDRFNATIAETARRAGIDYLPLNERDAAFAPPAPQRPRRLTGGPAARTRGSADGIAPAPSVGSLT